MKTLALIVLSVGALHAPAAGWQNPLPLHNGADVVFVPGVPSFGPLPGSGVIDPAAEFVYRVYPRQALRSPTGQLGLAGLRMSVYDTDPSTSAVLPDILICRGKPSSLNPGVIEPDFSDPSSILIAGGPAGFPPMPCPGGFASILQLAIDLNCGAGAPTIPADGSTDVAVVVFTPGGMPVSGGTCGFGDYSATSVWSVNEAQAAVLASGFNPYAGFHPSGTGPAHPVPASETPTVELMFCEPTIAVRIGNDPGLIGLHASVASAPTVAYTVVDVAGAGDLCLAASSLVPPLAAPLALFGAGLLLDPVDPAVGATLRTGVVAAGTPPFDPPKFVSANPLVVPAGAAGLSAWSQALIVDPVTLVARSTQVIETEFLP